MSWSLFDSLFESDLAITIAVIFFSKFVTIKTLNYSNEDIYERIVNLSFPHKNYLFSFNASSRLN